MLRTGLNDSNVSGKMTILRPSPQNMSLIRAKNVKLLQQNFFLSIGYMITTKNNTAYFLNKNNQI